MTKRFIVIGALLVSTWIGAAENGIEIAAVTSVPSSLGSTTDLHQVRVDSAAPFIDSVYTATETQPLASARSAGPSFSLPAALWLLGSIVIGSSILVSRKNSSQHR